jgi:hypothetical protein
LNISCCIKQKLILKIKYEGKFDFLFVPDIQENGIRVVSLNHPVVAHWLYYDSHGHPVF